VFRFLRSTSAKTETQMKIKYRSAEGWITDCISRLSKALRRSYCSTTGPRGARTELFGASGIIVAVVMKDILKAMS